MHLEDSSITVHVNQNGSMTRVAFPRWCTHFVSHLPKDRKSNPVLLIFDGHTSRWSYEGLSYLRRNHVFCLCLPSHTSIWSQPNDASSNSSWKAAFIVAIQNWHFKHKFEKLTQSTFNLIFSSAWMEWTTRNILLMKSTNCNKISSGWKRTGFYPYNRRPEFWESAIFSIGTVHHQTVISVATSDVSTLDQLQNIRSHIVELNSRMLTALDAKDCALIAEIYHNINKATKQLTVLESLREHHHSLSDAQLQSRQLLNLSESGEAPFNVRAFIRGVLVPIAQETQHENTTQAPKKRSRVGISANSLSARDMTNADVLMAIEQEEKTREEIRIAKKAKKEMRALTSQSLKSSELQNALQRISKNHGELPSRFGVAPLCALLRHAGVLIPKKVAASDKEMLLGLWEGVKHQFYRANLAVASTEQQVQSPNDSDTETSCSDSMEGSDVCFTDFD